MALTQVKTDGIANGAVTTQQLAPGAAGGPKVTQIQITNAGGTVLDDTAVSTSGGYIKITGTGFAAGAQVIINSTPATSVTFTSTTVLNVQVPAMSAGTYVVYVVNTDGGVAIAVNGLTYSGEPTWVTSSTLPTGVTATPISIQLSATGDTPITYALSAGNTLPTGLSLTSGGLLSGTVTVGAETTYNFSITATDVQAQDSPRTFSITITIGDPYFYLTTLLLPGNGTNNGTNNTFLDSSTNNFAITRNGNTTQGTYTPFSKTGWGIYQPSITTDFIGFTTSVGTNFQFPANFTIEAWVYPVSYGGTGDTSLWVESDGSTYFALNYDGSGNFNIYLNSGSPTSTFASGIVTNQWNHVAMVRNGSTVTLYTNGVSKGTITNSATLGYSSPSINRAGGGAATTVRYMSNLRIVKGTAVYTSAFTPPTTPLTNIANTVLLTFQNNRYIDNSSNNFTPSVNGSISIQSFSPFAPGAAYGTSTVGGSAYFDGSGDYLLSASTTAMNLGANPFCLEFWFYLSGTGNTYYGLCGSQTDYKGPSISRYGSVLMYGLSSNGSSWNVMTAEGTTGSTTINPYTWYHLALCRTGNTISAYINGNRDVTVSSAATLVSRTEGFCIGNWFSGLYPWLGYISNVRFVVGSNPYDATQTTITVPTSPVTAIANTQLLLNFTNGQITDATSKNDFETLADAKISTAQSKWGGSSMYFDGTGDYLVPRSNALLNFGTGDFTVEFWMYPIASTGDNGIYDSRTADLSTGGFTISLTDAEKIQFFSDSQKILGSTTIPLNQWTFIAVTRSGTALKLFVNGVLDGSATNSQNFSDTTLLIGKGIWASSEYEGYLQDFRLTKGYARYTANFTPPASAFPTL